ncbi:MAG: hypothetical protein HC811_10885 [Flammeovirgaceae bacterium]|nr:hypothetical protein [Flammeovirgaceae bacterium]
MGKRNHGKTAFTKYAIGKYLSDKSVYNVFAPREGTCDVKEFHRTLQDVTGLTGSASEIINALPHNSIVQIHDLELWWERTDQGLGIINQINDLIDRYGDTCMFVISMNPFAYRIINQLVKLENYLISTIECDKFSAENIKDLILLRHKSSGLSFEWRDQHESELSTLKTAQLFSHYFEYTGGNPGVALCGWLTHISGIDGKTISIRTPHKPDIHILSNLSADHRIVLAQIIIHKRTTLLKLGRVMNCDEMQADKLIRSLKRSGLVVESPPGTFALNIYVEPFVSKFLEENRMI